MLQLPREFDSGASTEHHLAQGGWEADLPRLAQDKTEADWEFRAPGRISWSAGSFLLPIMLQDLCIVFGQSLYIIKNQQIINWIWKIQQINTLQAFL